MIYILPVVAAGLIALPMAWIAWHRRPAPGAAVFAIHMLAIAEWSFGYAVGLSSSDLAFKILCAKIQYFGILTVPVTWFIFAVQYTGHDHWLRGRRWLGLLAVPGAALLFVWTNEWHGWIWATIELNAAGPVPVLRLSYGPAFFVSVTYAYSLLVGTTLLIAINLRRSAKVFRRQSIALLVATLIPWVGNFVYLLRLTPAGIDWTVVAFTFGSLPLALSLFRYRFLDLVPVAHEVIVRDMSDGVIVLSGTGWLVAMNPAAERILAVSAADAIGQPASRVLGRQPALLARYRNPAEAEPEISLKVGDEERFFDVRVSPLYEAPARQPGEIVVLRDVTAHRRAEVEHLELIREQTARTESEAALQTRSQIVSGISHDLRSPLATIKATSALVQRRLRRSDQGIDDRVLEGLARIEAMAGRMTGLLEELVEVTHLQMGQQLDLERRPVDLVDLVRLIADEQQAALRTELIQVETTLPALIGQWDPVRIERAITNLVTNAIKYSPHDTPIVMQVRSETDAAGVEWAIVSVADRGIGIPEADLPRVFDWFYRAANAIGQGSGTGVGLASSRVIIEQHGGTIDAASREGEGSTFTIRLPLVPSTSD